MTIAQSRYATPPSVLEQITALPNLPMPDIKVLWKRLFGTETPTHNRQFLERRIAYRLQEIEFRKVDRALVDRNKRRIQKIIDSGKNTKRDLQLMPGTVLIREYQGKEYRVLVTANGQYDYRGCSYRSLSRIAKEITGTAWSGLVFFGLKASSTTKKASKKGVHK